MSLFVAGAVFGEVAVSLFVASAVFGDVVMTKCNFAWQGQYLVKLERDFSEKRALNTQLFVSLEAKKLIRPY